MVSQSEVSIQDVDQSGVSIHLDGEHVAAEADPLLPLLVLPDDVVSEELGVEVAAEAELGAAGAALHVHQRDEDVEAVGGQDGGHRARTPEEVHIWGDDQIITWCQPH